MQSPTVIKEFNSPWVHLLYFNSYCFLLFSTHTLILPIGSNWKPVTLKRSCYNNTMLPVMEVTPFHYICPGHHCLSLEFELLNHLYSIHFYLRPEGICTHTHLGETDRQTGTPIGPGHTAVLNSISSSFPSSQDPGHTHTLSVLQVAGVRNRTLACHQYGFLCTVLNPVQWG